MAVYAAVYTFRPDPELRARLLGDHRAWLKGLFGEGRLLASGPWDHATGALLVFRADSPDEVRATIADDPFGRGGLVADAAIKEWTVIYGPWDD